MHICVADAPKHLETLITTDETGVLHLSNRLSFNNSLWSARVSSPLLATINLNYSITAPRFLTAGANHHVKSSSYMKAFKPPI